MKGDKVGSRPKGHTITTLPSTADQRISNRSPTNELLLSSMDGSRPSHITSKETKLSENFFDMKKDFMAGSLTTVEQSDVYNYELWMPKKTTDSQLLLEYKNDD